MKEILIRLGVAAFLTLAAVTLSSSARGQQVAVENPSSSSQLHSAQDGNSTFSFEEDSGSTANSTADSAVANADLTQDSFAFNGKIVAARGLVILMDPVTKIAYQLDAPTR